MAICLFVLPISILLCKLYCFFFSGAYKPIVKCFDLKQLSLKFEHGLDSEVLKMKMLTEDYSKVTWPDLFMW